MSVNRREFLRIGTTSGLSAMILPPTHIRVRPLLSTEPTAESHKTIRIAVVQMETIPGAVDTNRAKALRFASEALTHHPDLILFHEECLVGYVANYRDLAETKDGPTSKAFQALLSGTDSHVLWGLTERDKDKIYIAATLVNAQGIQANYRKTHLWWHGEGLRDETKSYTAGNELVTFDIKGHKCGVMICYDGDFPEMTRCYANIGCSVLFWLNNRPSRGHDEVKEHAERNSMIMPTACCTGQDETSHNCPGGSNITNYDGSLITEIWNKEGVLYADIDPAAALLARTSNPWYRGRRPEPLFQIRISKSRVIHRTRMT